ncbi:MAG: cell division protein ZapA [Bacteroidaceae bacterium]|nr:cell division protein ZapA [Bacteroidaceae bacterium]MCR4769068.1 cell division protein ZapA [Bacteroidaceae bacterium]
MEGNKITVNVRIGNVTLPMTVSNTEEEEVVRNAASLVQSKLNSFRDKFPKLPSEEYYYVMVAVDTALEALSASNKASIEPVMDIIEDLEKEIDEVIKK